MPILTDDPCACGHARREHDPSGCAGCDCELRAARVFARANGTEYEGWRPPFEDGHQLSVRHGANSPRLVDERTEVVMAELTAELPWTTTADSVTVEMLCRALAVLRPLDVYVAAVIDGRQQAYPRKGIPRVGVEAVPDVVWQQWSRAHKAVLDAASKLGMTPADRAKLFRDTGYAKVLALQACAEQVAPLRAAGRALRLKQRRIPT